MPKNEINKKWVIKDNILGFEANDMFIIPTAENIYSSVFENDYSNGITENDVKSLKDTFGFSKYPADLNILIRSGVNNNFLIEVNFQACLENEILIPLDTSHNADHVIIDKIWYPFPLGLIEELMLVLKSAGINELGKITLGQYLLLVKTKSDLVKNEVQPLNSIYYNEESQETPFNLKANLYAYQKKGWEWLRFMKKENIGGVLADEMGLGKTIQIISLFCSPKDKVFPSLIIAPSTLLENWRREFVKFAPHIKTHIHQGPKRTGFPSELKKYDLLITSYETIIRDSSLIYQINWEVVVCDEAQAIKNPQTKRSISIKKIPRKIGFSVTGTPIENSLTDLWSLMDFSVPGFLNSQSVFEKAFSNSQESANELEKIISPLILRRNVMEVAKDLPAKIIIPQVLELNEYEINIYESIRAETINEFKNNSSLVVLSRLRIFCTHPFLIENKPTEDPTLYSNKYKRLVEIIEETVANGSKILVFTSFTKMIDIIASDIKNRFGIYTNSIDGRTAIKDRQNIVDEFSNICGAALLALNPIAAGTGLNITAANHVIHYNLEWNPAKEDQASSRAYRRGQDRPVTIHRIFYANTVEEAINERLDRKRIIAGAAIIGVQGDKEDYDDILNAIHKSPK